jgi:peptide/nickel transport system substrate-binding protein
VPYHILGGVHMTNMRSVSFNSTQPVGAGPFQWQALELTSGSADKRQEKIALKAFDDYHAGKPKLNGFVVRTFRDSEQLIRSFEEQEINGMAGLSQVPETLIGNSGIQVYNLPLTAAVMTFFRTQNGLLADARIRQALVAATDTRSILDSLQYPTRPVRQTLLPGQIAYDSRYDQARYDKAAAMSMLEAAGWALGKDGVRVKDGKKLEFNLYYLDNAEYGPVATQLAKQWSAVGAVVRLTPQEADDFRGTLSQPGDRPYDALLYGISLGSDPDGYVYWHSSQMDVRSTLRLNFSEYRSGVADASLEAGRTRLDPALRTIKYQPFLHSWQADAPALGLYQPRFLYITHGTVDGLAETPINVEAGRFINVQNWQIRKQWVTPT